MATRRSSKTTPPAPAAPPAASPTAPRARTTASPARASAARSAPAKVAPAKANAGARRPAAERDEEHPRHERSVSIAATQHVVRSKNDGTIIARICVQSEHVLYGARDSKLWRRASLGDFASFMERAGELVKNWDGGN